MKSLAEQVIELKAERDYLQAQRDAEWNPYRQALDVVLRENWRLQMQCGQCEVCEFGRKPKQKTHGRSQIVPIQMRIS